MKPLKVEFAAFGSYPGVVKVDFTKLFSRGLFVISGDTGTGKTTVFDAMSFALFGDMPSKPPSDIRSHHADSSTETYAQFTFEAGGAVYIARRTPKYERLKKVGGGRTTESATASLQKRDGDQVALLASGARDVSQRIENIIGLNADQFQRVMVLPQGEVQRFLLENSSSRETLLRRLFGGDVFEKITERLKKQSDDIKDEVAATELQLSVQIDTAVQAVSKAKKELELESADEGTQPKREVLSEFFAELVEAAEGLQRQVETSRKAEEQARTEATEALGAAERYDLASGYRETLSKLAGREAFVSEAAAAAERSGQARPVVDAAEKASDTQNKHETATNAFEVAYEDLQTIGERADLSFLGSSPAEVAAVITQGSSDLGAQRATIQAHKDAAVAAESAANEIALWEDAVAANVEETKKLRSEAKSVDEQLRLLSNTPPDTAAIDAKCEELETARQDIETRDRLLADLQKAEHDRRAAEQVVRDKMVAYLQSAAPSLAAQLEDGKPCAVCGSTKHPQPAETKGDGSIVSHDDVENAQDELRQAEADQGQLQKDLAEVKGSLRTHADSEASDVSAQLQAAQSNRKDLVAAIAERDRLTAQREGLENQLAELDNRALRLSGEEDGLRRRSKEAEKHLEEAIESAAGIDSAALETRSAAIADLETKLGPYGELHRQKFAAARLREDAAGVLAGTLEVSMFATVDDARGALLPAEQEQAAEEAFDAHKAQTLEAKGGLASLVEQGIPETRPDVETITKAAEDAAAEADGLTGRNARVQAELARAQEAIDVYDTIEADSALLRARAVAAEHAHAVCHGSRDVNLLRWVLAQQLDQVAAVASEHLRQMSNGRYTIRRSYDGGGHGAKGLDLTIEDSHTGRSRMPTSLSGGEQFQASLALALGLADVVSRTGSTRSHSPEALFIDEGFGSLDQTALDEAINTLHSLQEQGRMVGVITHVEAMKERLHPGIVVERRVDGRGSTLTVNP